MQITNLVGRKSYVLFLDQKSTKKSPFSKKKNQQTKYLNLQKKDSIQLSHINILYAQVLYLSNNVRAWKPMKEHTLDMSSSAVQLHVLCINIMFVCLCG